MKKAKFEAVIKSAHQGGHYVEVPAKAAETAGLKYGVRVRGKVAGTPYRSSLMKYSGTFHMGVHKAVMQAAGVEAGDTVPVVIEIDDEPLPEDTVPPALNKALRVDAAVWAAWLRLSPAHKREWVKHVNDAKKEETRQSRIAKAVRELSTKARVPPAR